MMRSRALAASVDWIFIGLSPKAALRHGAALAEAGRYTAAFQQYVRAAHSGLAEAEYRLARCYLEGAGVPQCHVEAVLWLERAGHRGHVDAQSLLAIVYLNGLAGGGLFDPGRGAEPNYSAAAYWARKAAEAGSGEGQAILAHILISGPEDMRNPEESAAWYRRSAASACPNGMLGHALALIRNQGLDDAQEEIVENIRQAAEAGLPTALYLLAGFHEKGFGVAQDGALAVALYRRAAEAGHRAAQMHLGIALLEAADAGSDRSEAERWLRRAALNGEPEAAFRFGELCIKGGSAPPNYAEAAIWFQRAAEAGQKEAARTLGQLYLTGKGVPQDAAEAARWFRVAAAAGDSIARAELGNLALRGIGEITDAPRTAEYFAEAAQSGDPIAAFNYAVCLAQGIGVPRHDSEAAVWLRKAADKVANAQYWYGRFLVEGRGVAKDLPQGRTWLARAAEAGVADAQLTLDTMASEACDHAQGAPRTKDIARPATDAGDHVHLVEEGHLPDPRLNATKRALAPGAAWGAWHAAPSAAIRSDVRGDLCADDSDLCPCGSGLRRRRCCDLDPAYVCAPEARQAMEHKAAEAEEMRTAGETAAAERLCLIALDTAPRLSNALWTLAQIRRGEGKLRVAQSLLERLLAGDPNSLFATLELAALLFDEGDFVGAEQRARNAIRLAPENPLSHNLMGMILTEAQRPHVGEFHYRRVLELSATRDPIVLANLAWNLKGQGRIAEARALYEESAQTAPDVFQTLLGWAKMEEADRNFSAAHQLLDKAAGLKPDDPALRTAQAALFARQEKLPEALAALDLVGGGDAPDAITKDPGVLTEKGRILDELGRYDEAFQCFDQAKRRLREITGKCYLDREAEDLARRLQRFFVAERMRLMPSAPLRSEHAQPIFIMGFPRSGTTLTEQALSRHPKIAGGDELPFINELCDALPRLFGGPLAYPEALAELWMGDNRRGLEILRDIYLQRVQMRGIISPEVAWFTDKMPLNEMHLGLITLIFPNAPLIHMLRHPLDVVLSVFSHQMTHGYLCAYDLETIARHYVLIMNLVQHYQSQLSLNYLPIRYEDMVADLKGNLQLMLGFIGETWDERCVDFQESRRLPQTPSYAQVTQKLYDRSRYRYRHYLKHLEPVIPILEPVMDRLGYTVDA